jgi:hypothetical protein
MKRKLLIAGLVVLGLFVIMIVAVGLMQSSRGAGENYSQVRSTPDGKLIVEPTERQKSMFVVSSAATNLPATTNAPAR